MSEIEIIEVDAEEEEYDELYNITSWGADISFRELITMYDENEMLKPEFQRNYVWDKMESSRFIESLLMGLPVPSIFLAKVEDEKKLIIDGYQRIMTVYEYVKKGIYSKDGKVFKLSNSHSLNPKWRGKSYNELDESEKRKIRSTTIHAIIFEQKSPRHDDTSLYQIFERINTSGRALLPQEIRNCVYQGPLNSLLIELNIHPSWRKLYGSDELDSRMKDMELILRYFALSSDEIKNSIHVQISLKKYLNIFMGKVESNKPTFISDWREYFITTMDFIIKNFGPNAFHNFPKEKSLTRFNPTIFDSIVIATSYALRKNKDLVLQSSPDTLLHNLHNNDNFRLYTSERTTNLTHINGRIALALEYLYGMTYE